VERSTRAAKLRAEQRVQRFLDAAQAIITEKGGTDFTVQEVVDRSHQSLRSFYQHFDGKHELLLALFEDALRRATDQIRAAASGQSDPLDRLRVAIQLLFELSRPDPSARRPLFTDFAPRLLLSHPAEVKVAHVSLLALLTELMEQAQAAGVPDEESAHPLTAEEVWDFCANGFARSLAAHVCVMGRAPAGEHPGSGEFPVHHVSAVRYACGVSDAI
jgi:AcrR family transcriptional regulator